MRFCWQSTDTPSADIATATGDTISTRWNSRGCKIQSFRRLARTVANNADPPLVAPPPLPVVTAPTITAPAPTITAPALSTVGPAISATGPTAAAPDDGDSGRSEISIDVSSPVQNPLAELSPRFACQGDAYDDIQLSPTLGQSNFIATDLEASWKFADVISQKEPTPAPGKINLGPTQSVYLFVRPGEDGIIEEASSHTKLSTVQY